MKKPIALLLVLALVLSAAPMALAAGPPTLTLSADKTAAEPGDTVTVTLSIDQTMETGCATFIVHYDDTAYTYQSYTADYTGFLTVSNVSQGTGAGKVKLVMMDFSFASDTFTLNEGVIASMSFKANDANVPGAAFSLEVEAFEDAAGGDVTPTLEGENLSVPVSVPFVGYTVALGDDPAEVAIGETVEIPVVLGNTDPAVQTFNAYDLTFTYDDAKLSCTAPDEGSVDYTFEQPAAGTVRVLRYGEAAALGTTALTLTFEAIAAGEATVAFAEGKASDSATAISFDAPPAAASDDGSVTVTVAQPDTWPVTWDGSGKDDVENPATEAAANEPFSFTVNKAAGYTYTVSATMGGTTITVTEDPAGTYTTDVSVTGDLAITVNKTLSRTVEVWTYVELDNATFFLITVTGDPGENNTFFYDGAPMYLASNYGTGVWSYLVLVNKGDEAPTDTTAAALVTVAAGTAGALPTAATALDVNGTGKADVNDAQFVYNLYMAKLYDGFTEDVTMAKLLAADVAASGDSAHKVDAADAVAVVAGLS